MSTFLPPPAQTAGTSTGRSRRTESYAFQVNSKHYTLQFWPMTYLGDYEGRQLAALAATAAYEVSFRLEAHTLPDGSVVAGYDVLGTGDAFLVLGGVANGILDWTKERQPTFLYWQAHSPRRQRLYEHMIRAFAARGSSWRRLSVDPFTGVACRPEAFWLRPCSHVSPSPERLLPGDCLRLTAT